MRAQDGNHTQLASTASSILKFNEPKKISNSTWIILEFCSRLKLYNLLVTRQSSSLSPSLSPCRPYGNHSAKLFQETIKGFDCKINGSAFGAALLHSLGWLTCGHKHRVFPRRQHLLLAPTGSLEKKSATTFAILT